jgi:hypothetical protein
MDMENGKNKQLQCDKDLIQWRLIIDTNKSYRQEGNGMAENRPALPSNIPTVVADDVFQQRL